MSERESLEVWEATPTGKHFRKAFLMSLVASVLGCPLVIMIGVLTLGWFDWYQEWVASLSTIAKVLIPYGISVVVMTGGGAQELAHRDETSSSQNPPTEAHS